jgi:hypothetical protein
VVEIKSIGVLVIPAIRAAACQLDFGYSLFMNALALLLARAGIASALV